MSKDKFPKSERAANVLQLAREGKSTNDIMAALGLERHAVSKLLSLARNDGLLPPASIRDALQPLIEAAILRRITLPAVAREVGCTVRTVIRVRDKMKAAGKITFDIPREPYERPIGKRPSLRRVSSTAVRAVEKRERDRVRVAAGPQLPIPTPRSADYIAGLAAQALEAVQPEDLCRWPIGDIGVPGFHFCGCERHSPDGGPPAPLMGGGYPYCTTHTYRASATPIGSYAAAGRVPAEYRMASL